AGGHRAALAGSQIDYDRLEALAGVVHQEADGVARVHREVRARIGAGRGGGERAGGQIRNAASGDVGQVDALQAGLAHAVGVVRDAAVLIVADAEDRQRGVPVHVVETERRTRRIELQLHVG